MIETIKRKCSHVLSFAVGLVCLSFVIVSPLLAQGGEDPLPPMGGCTFFCEVHGNTCHEHDPYSCSGSIGWHCPPTNQHSLCYCKFNQ
jgi:hypothetical protein